MKYNFLKGKWNLNQNILSVQKEQPNTAWGFSEKSVKSKWVAKTTFDMVGLKVVIIITSLQNVALIPSISGDFEYPNNSVFWSEIIMIKTVKSIKSNRPWPPILTSHLFSKAYCSAWLPFLYLGCFVSDYIFVYHLASYCVCSYTYQILLYFTLVTFFIDNYHKLVAILINSYMQFLAAKSRCTKRLTAR